MAISVAAGVLGAISQTRIFYPLLFVSMISAATGLVINLTRGRRQRRALRRT